MVIFKMPFLHRAALILNSKFRYTFPPLNLYKFGLSVYAISAFLDLFDIIN